MTSQYVILFLVIKLKKIYFVIFILLIVVFILSCLYLKNSVMISQSSISYVDDNDIVGSIKIDSIKLSNLLLQGLDNRYYLNHNYLKKENENGEIFLDYQGDLFKNNNAIIYSKFDNIPNISDIKSDDKIEVFYLYKTICYKVLEKSKNYNLELRIINKKTIDRVYAKKVNC